MHLHQKPIEGVPMIEPANPPHPDEVLLGYEVINEHKKFLRKPDPKHMNKVGWFSVIVCAIIFWPVSCIPCCLGCSYSMVQRPVYGHKKEDLLIQTDLKED